MADAIKFTYSHTRSGVRCKLVGSPENEDAPYILTYLPVIYGNIMAVIYSSYSEYLFKEAFTDPAAAFLVLTERIKPEDLLILLDSKLINQKHAAARFRALSLAVNPATTDERIYAALIEHDCHPEIVSVVVAMGKSYVVETEKLLNNHVDYNSALYAAARTGSVEAMKLLRELGASNFYIALATAAANGRIEAMKLLKDWGATNYSCALGSASAGGSLAAMTLLKSWGASDFNAALYDAASEGRVEAMKLLESWGASQYDWALAVAKSSGNTAAATLLNEWICR